MRIKHVLLIAAALVLVPVADARAKPARPPAREVKRNPKLEPGDAVKEKQKAKKKAHKGGAFELETINIEGKIYKPQAFHVINRKELNLEWDVRDPRFKRSFLTSLIDAVRHRPF